MLGILPTIFMGGAALMFTERFIQQPTQRRERYKRQRRPFDKQEYRDNRRKVRGMEFGDFSNIGW